MFSEEGLPGVQCPVGVEIDVADQQSRSGLELGGGHVRVETGPGGHVSPFQRRPSIAVLEIDQLHVALLEPSRLQRAEEEEKRIRSPGGGDPLALEVGQALGLGVLGHHQRRPFRLRVDVDDLERNSVGAGEQRGGSSGGGQVGAPAGEELVGLVAALAEEPGDPRSVRGQRLLEPAELLQHQAAGVVGGVVEPELLERSGVCPPDDE
jgi:hypothetical protein